MAAPEAARDDEKAHIAAAAAALDVDGKDVLGEALRDSVEAAGTDAA